jgi:hypothetical protein
MTYFQFCLRACLVGVLVPVVVMIVLFSMDALGIDPLSETARVGRVVATTLWPSFLPYSRIVLNHPFYLANLTILFVAIMVNALIYCGIGSLLWLGMHRTRWMLIFASILILGYWFVLLRLLRI